jgi:hypothetical protein
VKITIDTSALIAVRANEPHRKLLTLDRGLARAADSIGIDLVETD